MHSSSRGGAKVIWVAVHTAEGSTTTESLLRYFQDTSDPNRGSSHAAIDDGELEQGGPWVPYDRAAWTLRNGNEESDNVEVCGFARWSRAEWLRHGRMLELVAVWIAQRCKARGIPIRKLTPSQVGQRMAGVIGHVDYTLGTGDGTHTDPGPNFPWDLVITRAREIANPSTEDDDMTPAELFASRVGANYDTAFDEYSDNPGTVGHFMLGLRTRTNDVEPMLRQLLDKVDALSTEVATLKERIR